MQRLNITLAALLLGLTAATVFAADVTGTWTGQMGGPDGGGFTITFHFKQDGAKLTGTMEGPQGDPMQIAAGKVEGNKISFSVTMGGPDGGDGMKMTQEGTISGDEIKLTTKMEGGPEGGRGGPPDGGPGPGGPMTMTLKRSK